MIHTTRQAPWVALFTLAVSIGGIAGCGTNQQVQMNNLKQVGLALMMYHDAQSEFPTGIYDAEGKPLLSWRVQLLPYLEHAQLYEQFHLDEPWDSEHNKVLMAQMPAVFGSSEGKSRVVSFTGDRPKSMADVTDGRANTIFCVLVAEDKAVNWTEPTDIAPTAEAIKAAAPGSSIPVVMYDAATLTVPKDFDDNELRRMIDHQDGEPIMLP